jgi:hypothetical protein
VLAGDRGHLFVSRFDRRGRARFRVEPMRVACGGGMGVVSRGSASRRGGFGGRWASRGIARHRPRANGALVGRLARRPRVSKADSPHAEAAACVDVTAGSRAREAGGLFEGSGRARRGTYPGGALTRGEAKKAVPPRVPFGARESAGVCRSPPASVGQSAQPTLYGKDS